MMTYCIHIMKDYQVRRIKSWISKISLGSTYQSVSFLLGGGRRSTPKNQSEKFWRSRKKS